MQRSTFSAFSLLRLTGTLLLLLCLSPVIRAQQFTYKFTSTPDSATVSLNGVSLGKTPLEAKIDWSKLPSGGFVFLFTRSGYDDEKFVVSEKPKVKENFKDMKLTKALLHFEVGSDAVLVKFDKVMTEFPLGKIIGHNKTFYGGDITWEAYSRVGAQQFALRADDVLGSAGFRTPFIKGNELFSDQAPKPEIPRFLIGGKVTDIWVELGPTTLSGLTAKNWCKVEWKVYDKVLKKVVLTDVSRGEFEGKYLNLTELNVMMDLFQDAMENFLMNGKLFQLVTEAAGVAPTEEDEPGESTPDKR